MNVYALTDLQRTIAEAIAEKRGEPYRSFPVDMMRYGGGGTGDSGSLCGALNGGAALIGLFARSEDETNKLIAGLFLWYEQTKLPAYVPPKSVLNMEMPTSVSNSILCHVSISRWCAASGHKAFDDKRNERCCRLTADVARKTIEILNANFIGKYRADAALSEGDKACHSCHTKGSELSNTRGNMSCGGCHFTLAKEHPKVSAG